MRSNSRFRNAFLFLTLGAISGFCGPLGQKYRLLVLITESARPHVGSEAALTSIIREKLVDYTREAYINSDASSTYVMPDVELAGVLRVSYTEAGGNLSSDLANVTNSAGALAPVASWRNLYSADLVMLVVYGPQEGASWGKAKVKVGQDYGFSVLNMVSYWDYYTAAHEIGHNFGCTHHVGSLGTAYSYGRGYESLTGGRWRDIMAPYVTGSTTIRQKWFSNPYMTVGSEARGTTSSNNCTRVHEVRTAHVAGFRTAPYSLDFESVLRNGEYAHLAPGHIATLKGGGALWPLAEAYVEAEVVYWESNFVNMGKVTVDGGGFVHVNDAGLGDGSQTKIFSVGLADLSRYTLGAGEIRVEASEIWSGEINHSDGSEGIFIAHGIFRKKSGNMNVSNGKIWVQAEDVNLVWLQSGLKLSNNAEAQIAATGKVSFGSGTSFVNSKVRIDIGPGSTISGYPLFKSGDLKGQVETKEALAASSHFRSKVRQENDKMVLEYDLPGISSVDVGLYLANGKLIQKRKLGTKRGGTHLEVFDGISPGAVYLLHIKAGVHTATHRIIR